MRRSVRLSGHLLLFALLVLAAIAAVRFFWGALEVEGWTPRTFFALLLLTGAIALVWREALTVRKAAKRLRG